MKKYLIGLMVLAAALSLTSCKKETPEPTVPETEAVIETQAEVKETKKEAPAETKAEPKETTIYDLAGIYYFEYYIDAEDGYKRLFKVSKDRYLTAYDPAAQYDLISIDSNGGVVAHMSGERHVFSEILLHNNEIHMVEDRGDNLIKYNIRIDPDDTIVLNTNSYFDDGKITSGMHYRKAIQDTEQLDYDYKMPIHSVMKNNLKAASDIVKAEEAKKAESIQEYVAKDTGKVTLTKSNLANISVTKLGETQYGVITYSDGDLLTDNVHTAKKAYEDVERGLSVTVKYDVTENDERIITSVSSNAKDKLSYKGSEEIVLSKDNFKTSTDMVKNDKSIYIIAYEGGLFYTEDNYIFGNILEEIESGITLNVIIKKDKEGTNYYIDRNVIE